MSVDVTVLVVSSFLKCVSFINAVVYFTSLACIATMTAAQQRSRVCFRRASAASSIYSATGVEVAPLVDGEEEEETLEVGTQLTIYFYFFFFGVVSSAVLLTTDCVNLCCNYLDVP